MCENGAKKKKLANVWCRICSPQFWRSLSYDVAPEYIYIYTLTVSLLCLSLAVSNNVCPLEDAKAIAIVMFPLSTSTLILNSVLQRI